MSLNTVEMLEEKLDSVLSELAKLRDRLEDIHDESESILSDVTDALDSIEYAKDALSRQI